MTSDLVIIGAGHNPSKQSPLPSTFGGIEVWAPNVQLIGLIISNLNASNFCSATVVKRCRLAPINGNAAISINQNANDWVIEGNIFIMNSGNASINFNFQNTSNTRISNNIFTSYVGVNSIFTPPGSFNISNNIFLSNNQAAFLEIYSASIANNIFVGAIPSNGVANATMNHNISYGAFPGEFLSPGVGNLAHVDPLFMSYPGNGAFSYTYDYRLAPGSPGIDTGSDGTDRGVYGGMGNKFNITGEPGMAQVTAFTITSPTTIAPNGTLTISVTSKRVD
jgi:hypothetical protein